MPGIWSYEWFSWQKFPSYGVFNFWIVRELLLKCGIFEYYENNLLCPCMQAFDHLQLKQIMLVRRSLVKALPFIKTKFHSNKFSHSLPKNGLKKKQKRPQGGILMNVIQENPVWEQNKFILFFNSRCQFNFFQTFSVKISSRLLLSLHFSIWSMQ